MCLSAIKFSEIASELSLINYIDVKTFNDSNSITHVNENVVAYATPRRACTPSMIFDEKFPRSQSERCRWLQKDEEP